MTDLWPIIQKKYAMDVILWFADKTTLKTECMRAIDPGNPKTVFMRIQELIEAGVLEHWSTETGATRVTVSDRGRGIAEAIRALREASS